MRPLLRASKLDKIKAGLKVRTSKVRTRTTHLTLATAQSVDMPTGHLVSKYNFMEGWTKKQQYTQTAIMLSALESAQHMQQVQLEISAALHSASRAGINQRWYFHISDNSGPGETTMYPRSQNHHQGELQSFA